MENKVLNYRIILKKEKYSDGSPVYSAYCPTLGIADYGDTVEKVLESLKDGIELAVESLIKEGKEIPIDNPTEEIITNTQVTIPDRCRPVLA